MAATELDRRGWHLTGESITDLFSDGKGTIDDIIKKILDTDLKDIGKVWLNEDINSGQINFVKGPCVLQLLKLRSISSPQDDETSPETPYISLLTLTDGHITCSAVTLEPIKGFSLNTPPGSKVLLSGTVKVESNFLLLSNKNTSLLGGWVSSLAETWQLKKALAKESKTLTNAVGEGAPPPFVPFGQKIASDVLLSLQKDNFKSLHKTKEKKITDDEIQFQQLRQTALKEAHQAKISKERNRAYGGQNFVNARDVTRIMEMGLSPGGAESALIASNGDVNQAVNTILLGRQGYQNGRENPESPKFNKSTDVGSYVENNLSHKFNKYATVSRPESSRLPFHGPHHSISYSQYSHGHHGYQGTGRNHSSFFRQHQSTAPQYGRVGQGHGSREHERKDGETNVTGRDGSHVNKPSVISNQNQTLVKENSQPNGSEASQTHRGTNQNDKSKNLGEQHQESELKICDYKNSSDSQTILNSQNEGTHNSPGQYVQNEGTQNSPGQYVQNEGANNSPGQYVQNEQTKYNSDNQRKLNNPQEGSSRSNSEDQSVGNKHYGRHCNSLPHDQWPPGAYPHQPFQGNHGRQGYNNHQVNRLLNVGQRCLAKYWQDQIYYPAVVKAMITESRAVVMFSGFGNVEEIDIKDTLSCFPQTYQVPHPGYGMRGMHPPLLSSAPFFGAPPFMPPPSFNGSGRRYYSSIQGRPTQKYYQPPQQRHY